MNIYYVYYIYYIYVYICLYIIYKYIYIYIYVCIHKFYSLYLNVITATKCSMGRTMYFEVFG